MFRNRVDAGDQLARKLEHLRGTHAVVLGLPRGGVPVAARVARALDLPLDVIVVRKLGLPFQPEVAMGAIGEGGIRVLNRDILSAGTVSQRDIARAERMERTVLLQRLQQVRRVRPRVPLDGATAVVVDDGIATGATVLAACRVARAFGAARVVVAAPVGAPEIVRSLSDVADEVVCLVTPPDFRAVGAWYEDFSPTTDEEMLDLLAGREHTAGEPPVIGGGAFVDPPVRDDEVEIDRPGGTMGARLVVPQDARAVVVLAHPSGTCRFSPRNRYVATMLNRVGFATVMLDLLTIREEVQRHAVADVGMLAQRLSAATEWVGQQPDIAGLPLAYFGVGTGAAAAVIAAAQSDGRIRAIVARSGRPDLAGEWIAKLDTPLLMIVGSRDPAVLALNRRVERHVTVECDVVVVNGASHSFSEPGSMQRAGAATTSWLVGHLVGEE